MSKPAYWLANSIVDLTKTIVTVGLILLISLAFEDGSTETEALQLFLLIYIPVIVSFTYMMSSLCFKDELSAQIVTLFMHFLMGGIMAPVQYFLTVMPDPGARDIGYKLRWWLQPFPTFSIC